MSKKTVTLENAIAFKDAITLENAITFMARMLATLRGLETVVSEPVESFDERTKQSPTIRRLVDMLNYVVAFVFYWLVESPNKRIEKYPTHMQFDSIFPQLVEDLSEHTKKYGIPPNALEWYHRSLNHNTVGGKCNRGKSVVDTTFLLLGRRLTDEEYFKAATLGWCTELLQASLLVSDDIMDSSKTRRGSPCWYLMPGVGMIAINDAFMLESAIFVLLKKYFRQEKCYLDLHELFQEVIFKTEIGQLCDLLTAPEDRVNLHNFSLEKYNYIVVFKTAYYSFYLPVSLSLHLLNLATPKNLEQAEKILTVLGEYFQVQDDYLDNFGAPEVIGKIGTDIKDNKCSWLINQALQLASLSQREILEKHYGQRDAASEAEVKEVFAELKLGEVYREYEEGKVEEIRRMIANVDESEGLKRSVFEAFLSKIYKRNR